MAAGAARRYGGLKQLAPVGPGGEAIMEYSIHDALAGGFGKVVLVVRREFEQQFRDKFVDKFLSGASAAAPIDFAYQELESSVPERHLPVDRPKPWGTGHAVLCAKDLIDRPFAVINADDFYGPSALAEMGRFLTGVTDSQPMTGAMIGYQLRNTLSDHGTVSRGVCEANPDGTLATIVERHSIARDGDDAVLEAAEGKSVSISGDAIVSMNLWGYPAGVFSELEQRFHAFLDSPREPTQEYEIPTVTRQMMDDGLMTVRVFETKERWCGMTYQEDLPIAQQRIAELVEAGNYPSKLWSA